MQHIVTRGKKAKRENASLRYWRRLVGEGRRNGMVDGLGRVHQVGAGSSAVRKMRETVGQGGSCRRYSVLISFWHFGTVGTVGKGVTGLTHWPMKAAESH